MPHTILMVVSEMAPFSKTGGLGDVGAALPSALARLGHDVTVVTPRYRGVIGGAEVERFAGGELVGGYATTVLEHREPDGVRIWFVDCPAFFDRAGIYGEAAGDYPDSAERFGLLSHVALETAARIGLNPSVVHAHDWQAGLTPAYVKTRYASAALGQARVVFTIHNLAYQGMFEKDIVPVLKLGWETYTSDGLEFWDRVSFLKAGINYSDAVTTVSRRYAEEIQVPELGCGFDGVLRQRAGVLTGIPNGIDTVVWDPAADPWLPAAFSATDLRGKVEAKHALLGRFGMQSPAHLARPVIGMVSRMVDQKGLDLIAAAERELMALDAAFVVLGTGAPKYEAMWQRLTKERPHQVAATVGFSEELAHLIEAGADIFLMPSRFEPCGLNQMYSLRYGTVPVVRATGGLDDTVRDADVQAGSGTGFKFGPYTPAAMLEALRAALKTFRSPQAWRRIQQAGMREDHSWDKSAREYVTLYDGR